MNGRVIFVLVISVVLLVPTSAILPALAAALPALGAFGLGAMMGKIDDPYMGAGGYGVPMNAPVPSYIPAYPMPMDMGMGGGVPNYPMPVQSFYPQANNYPQQNYPTQNNNGWM